MSGFPRTRLSIPAWLPCLGGFAAVARPLSRRRSPINQSTALTASSSCNSTRCVVTPFIVPECLEFTTEGWMVVLVLRGPGNEHQGSFGASRLLLTGTNLTCLVRPHLSFIFW